MNHYSLKLHNAKVIFDLYLKYKDLYFFIKIILLFLISDLQRLKLNTLQISGINFIHLNLILINLFHSLLSLKELKLIKINLHLLHPELLLQIHIHH